MRGRVVSLLFYVQLASLLVTVLSACSSQPVTDNEYCGDRPCWVVHTPRQGVVVSMSEHVDSAKTREVLFNKALVELAAASEGFNVSQDSLVKKTVISSNGESQQQAQVISLANVNTGGGELRVRAKIRDQWREPGTGKLYLWVIRDETE